MKEKILIVEDNPRHMRLLEMTLGAKGYSLLKATDGDEALNIATSEHPNLILMDIQLPKVSGLEVTRRIREIPAFDSVPIIAITAYAMNYDKERAIEVGCNAHLSKPINTRELPEIIAQMLSQRCQDNN